jgi:hypothetical protein
VNVAQCKLLTTHRGVCCCVSYTRTESSVATAYIMRYGKQNAIVGPGVEAFASSSRGFVLGDGGGSMTECDGDLGATAGSGRAFAKSSDDEVSIVICFV